MQENDSENPELDDIIHFLEQTQSSETFGEEVEFHRTLGHSLNLALYKVIEYHPMSVENLSKVFKLKEHLIAQNLKNLEKIGAIYSEAHGEYTIFKKKI